MEAKQQKMPPRIKKPSVSAVILILIAVFFIVTGLINAEITVERLVSGVENIGNFVMGAFPPDFSRFGPIFWSLVETFQMALTGTMFGVILSLPLAILSSKNTSPFGGFRLILRGLISAIRTIPDLVWALLFIISVGLGPLPGIMTITIDTIGFCVKFFTERIEEMSSGPQEALESTGASYFGVITGAIIPQGMPSFIGTSLYAVEKAIRSATILGLVGAGGIGIELDSAMSLRQFDEALMIILMILILVLTQEHISNKIREKFL